MPLTLPQLERHLFEQRRETVIRAANLKDMRAFAEAWPDARFVQAVLAQLPWYHQLLTSRAHAALLLDV